MSKKINYSVIIPHKNIPKLLQRCLSSIPSREDIQIIVVDDNSDPDIVDFGQFPGLYDPFVEVIFTKEGKGAGYARNVGITKAVGKWLLFADADDFYSHCINDILDEYVNSEADIIYFKNNNFILDTHTVTYRHGSIRYNAYIDYWRHTPEKAERLLRYKHLVPWAKIIKKYFIEKKNILFDEVSIANDITFSNLAGLYAEYIYADSRVLYNYTIRNDSIQHGQLSIEKKLDLVFVFGKRYRFLQKHGISGFCEHTVFFFTKFLLFDRSNLDKANKIFIELGFSSLEIIKFYLYSIFMFCACVPTKIIKKIFYWLLQIP